MYFANKSQTMTKKGLFSYMYWIGDDVRHYEIAHKTVFNPLKYT